MPSKAFLECGQFWFINLDLIKIQIKPFFRMWAILFYDFGLIKIYKNYFIY